MREPKFTKGEWKVDDVDRNGQPQITSDCLIAVVCHECVMPREELEANARLIAAAPDLLKALSGALVLIETMESAGYDIKIGDKARAALKKALGED